MAKSHHNGSPPGACVIFAVPWGVAAGVWLKARGVPHKALAGQWQGEAERSYLVPLSHWGWRLELQVYCAWGQDSVLLLDAHHEDGRREASLLRRGQPPRYLGLWRAATLGEAWHRDHTYDPSTGQYYVIDYAHAADAVVASVSQTATHGPR